MKKLNVIERFNTSLGLTFIVAKEDFKVGDMFFDQYNESYRVEKIIMPTRPTNTDECALIVTKYGGI